MSSIARCTDQGCPLSIFSWITGSFTRKCSPGTGRWSLDHDKSWTWRMSCGGFKWDAVGWIIEERGLRQMDLEGGGRLADTTLRGRWKKHTGFWWNISGHRLASHDLCYCKVKVCPQSRLSFPAFVSNLLSKRYGGLKIVTLDQFYIKFNFL